MIQSKTLGHLFLTFGIIFLFIVGFLTWQRYTPKRLAFDTAKLSFQNHSNDLSPQPTTITIKDLDIYLPIYSTALENDHWQTTSQGVSYLIDSAIPGEKGNSILYGHNWPSLLKNLPQIKPGQEIAITFTDGISKNFAVEYTSVVTPDQTHVLNPTGYSRITIYTCSGFLDRKRFVVVAKPINS